MGSRSMGKAGFLSACPRFTKSAGVAQLAKVHYQGSTTFLPTPMNPSLAPSDASARRPAPAAKATQEAKKARRPAREGAPPVADLRKLESGERVAHWVKVHLKHLESWNQQGWRWAQIATAVAAHIERNVTRNKLTGMVTMIRKGKLAQKVQALTIGG